VISFFTALSLLCASTLMYEIVLTRLLSVTSWYYMAFVSISMAMFGMTAGALFVQLFPKYFSKDAIPLRLTQATMGAAISLPICLLTALAVPLDLSASLQTLYSFLLFSIIIATPFFFSGMAVCLSLTRTPFPIGRVYFADLFGAAMGCLGSAIVLQLIDAPSALFFVSALLFVSASAYASYSGEHRLRRLANYGVLALLVVSVLNSTSVHGIQPIWSKGSIDRRLNILSEHWNPISRVRASHPTNGPPMMWGPSPIMPHFTAEEIAVNIDNDAGTAITRFQGDLGSLNYFRYDVTAIAAQLRAGSSAAAVIGVGGGRDVLNCAINGFHRIVGIEVNGAMVRLTSRQLNWFSGFSKIPGFQLVNDEGRSYLTRSGEKFDIIQASLVDTWAATSAGAMTLTENALYTVDGWKVFYEHLRPGGIITFSRWDIATKEALRLYSVAKATLLIEGTTNPDLQIALLHSGKIMTLLVSNQPFTDADLAKIRGIADDMHFTVLLLPGQPPSNPDLKILADARTLEQLASFRNVDNIDVSPVFDSSPYFFNSVHLRYLPAFLRTHRRGGNLFAMLFLCGFLFAAVILVASTIVVPAWLLMKRAPGASPAFGGIVYFLAIGLGFMLIEMGMMQQLSIFLGHPIYSLIIVLAGLILSTGIGSVVSDRLPLSSAWQSRVPPLAVAAVIVLYKLAVVPAIHTFVAGVLWQRGAVALALVFPCGFLLGFCFPVGMRWITKLGGEASLPWMWALNGAAGTLGSFVAVILSMETSIAVCVLTGAAFYLLGALSMPSQAPHVSTA
jgi:spermidine synthase